MNSGKDLSGLKFGRLTPTTIAYRKDYQNYWNCVCDCGKQIITRAYALTSGKTKSCGCQKKISGRNRAEDLTGKTIGNFYIIGFSHQDNAYRSHWKCRCNLCGSETTVEGFHIKSGKTISCGCYLEQIRGKHNITHGGSSERLYRIWKSMINRCFDKTNKNYFRYGGRGITVCKEWADKENGYVVFREWSNNNGYDKVKYAFDCTIDRIDNNKGYSPDNCRWVNMLVQANNTRKNVFVEYKGERMTIAQLARKYDIPYKMLWKRIHTFKWSIDEAVETPKVTTLFGRR